MYALLQHQPEFLAWMPLVTLVVMVIGGAVLVQRVSMMLDRFLEEMGRMEAKVNEHEKQLAIIVTVCRYRHPDEVPAQ